mmetsp:Transcript_25077/g.40491  ORF Transcript_25077/g.40491 Transcript_25077/m.40491 type:complete len:217 (+) Transcript_25077:1-651(+)
MNTRLFVFGGVRMLHRALVRQPLRLSGIGLRSRSFGNTAVGTKDFNFAAASEGDSILHGSCRPGYGDNETPRGVDMALVDDWVAFMQSQDVKRVVSLLGDDELEWYDGDIEQKMRDSFQSYIRVPMFKGDAKSKIIDAIEEARASEEKVVVHCSGGGGRCGLALAVGVLSTNPIITTEEDVKEAIEGHAKSAGVKRKVDIRKLSNILSSGNAAGSK